MNDKRNFEVIIIGGSYSGLSAAMSLGRSLRSVLVIDSGLPCNRQTPHSHNFITQDGKTPKEISTLAKQQVQKYETVKFLNGIAINAAKQKNGFRIETQSGETFYAKKLIFATGIKDLMPDIKGFSDCWGISVIHCPYCHGYEFHHQKTAIMANGDKAMHLASLVNNITKDLSILTSGKADFSREQKEKLNNADINIVSTDVSEIEHHDRQVKAVIFKDGSKLTFDAVYASISFVQHSPLPALLGCELTEQGLIKINAFQQTTMPGIFACGDNTTLMRSIASSVSTGSFAGAMTNKELCEDEF